MKTFLFTLLFPGLVYACQEMPKKSPTEARLNNVSFNIDEPKVFCLTLPAGNTSTIVEFKTVNKGNSSCGDLKLVIIAPDKHKYKSNGSQPGVAAFYQQGKWKMKYVLKSGCNLYDLYATWVLK